MQSEKKSRRGLLMLFIKHMKNVTTIGFLALTLNLSAQVNLGALSLQNKVSTGGFYHTTYCAEDSIQTTVLDTGSTAGFQYRWSFHKTDSSQVRGKTLLSKSFTTGAIDFALIDAALDSVKKTGEPLVLFELTGKNASSGDTAILPLLIKTIPKIDSAHIYIRGRDVFLQSNYVGFSKTFPGPWVGPYVVEPRIYFEHGYYDYLLIRMTEFDSTGQALRRVLFDVPNNDTVVKFTAFPEFGTFGINTRTLDPNDMFFKNTSREYYRFAHYHGVYGCGCDSIYTYFRVINPNEFSLGETQPAVVSFFPSPVKDDLMYSSLPESNGSYSIEIIDMSGRPLMEAQLSETNGSIPLKLKSGFYIYHLKDEDGKVMQVGKLLAE